MKYTVFLIKFLLCTEGARHKRHITEIIISVLHGMQNEILTLHTTQHTHHNLKHMLPQYCANYNDVFLLIVSTKKVTLARLKIDSLMMVGMDQNM
jgi:hypothetical protein